MEKGGNCEIYEPPTDFDFDYKSCGGYLPVSHHHGFCAEDDMGCENCEICPVHPFNVHYGDPRFEQLVAPKEEWDKGLIILKGGGMMTERKHSPIPFHKEFDEQYEVMFIYAEDGTCIGETTTTPDYRLNDINAEFVLTACNSHYELLEALEEVEHQLYNYIAEHYGSYTAESDVFIRQARAVITKAKGE
jgi:hypothetical protein